MKIAVLVLDEVFDSGLTTVLDTLHTANELATLDALQAAGATDIAFAMADAGAPSNADTPNAAPPPPFELQLVGLRPHVRTALGFEVQPTLATAALQADWVVVPALNAKLPPALARALDRPDVDRAKQLLRCWHAMGHGVAAACTGTYVVADAGLLNGARATTTWSLSPFFRQRYPQVQLDDSRMVQVAGRVVTAAAMMGHLDLALWLVRQHSPALAARVARFMLIDTRTSQAHYIIPDHLAHADPLVARFEAWCQQHLALGFDLQRAADALAVHPRTLQRRMEAVLGTSPLAFFQDVRIERAQQRVAEHRDLDSIATEVGYADGTTLRRLLRRKLGYGVRDMRSRAR